MPNQPKIPAILHGGPLDGKEMQVPNYRDEIEVYYRGVFLYYRHTYKSSPTGAQWIFEHTTKPNKYLN